MLCHSTKCVGAAAFSDDTRHISGQENRRWGRELLFHGGMKACLASLTHQRSVRSHISVFIIGPAVLKPMALVIA